MNRVEWSGLAIADLETIDDWWSAYSEAAAERVAAKIENAALFLTRTPRAGPRIDRADARKWRVATTPYVLIYRPIGDGIEILRIHHGSQDWRND